MVQAALGCLFRCGAAVQLCASDGAVGQPHWQVSIRMGSLGTRPYPSLCLSVEHGWKKLCRLECIALHVYSTCYWIIIRSHVMLWKDVENMVRCILFLEPVFILGTCFDFSLDV